MRWRFYRSRTLVPLLLGWWWSGVAQAGFTPDFKLNLNSFSSAGPMMEAMVLPSDHRLTGSLALGVGASWIGSRSLSEWREPAMSTALCAGYVFKDQRYVVNASLTLGLWLLSAGVAVSPSFGRGGADLAMGPMLISHFRLNTGAAQHEIQLVANLLVSGWSGTPYQLGAGVRFLFDLD